jgi:hypothetical protein
MARAASFLPASEKAAARKDEHVSKPPHSTSRQNFTGLSFCAVEVA